jgi:hypothetical protein
VRDLISSQSPYNWSAGLEVGKVAKRRLRFRQDKLLARTQLSRSRMHDLIFLFDRDGERFVGGS